ncbi:5539_t:CDS:1 [Paraglomus brasilianum]|uniref:5539_t:CDS:1 n=1 Tax=Paraglomus brasilianum TaxID=144538 RepID=A0A9N9BSJ0_9GLOM|nr:5539_t:CDS:1 [Paraglomus brasilianum]
MLTRYLLAFGRRVWSLRGRGCWCNLSLYAGFVVNQILAFMNEGNRLAEKGEAWPFLDEIHTCNHIGLLADLIAHGVFSGNQYIRTFVCCRLQPLSTAYRRNDKSTRSKSTIYKYILFLIKCLGFRCTQAEDEQVILNLIIELYYLGVYQNGREPNK